jgi:hypothetical protein
LVEAFQDLFIGLNPVAGLEDLGRLFEKQGSHLPSGQAAAQIEKGAVFFAGSAVAVGAATSQEALQEGGVKGIENASGGVNPLNRDDFESHS